MSDELPDPGMSAFARALRGVRPHPGNLERDRLLFAAGRAAEARRRQGWQWSAVGLGLVSIGLVAVLWARPTTTIVAERFVYVQVPAASPPATASGASAGIPPATDDVAPAEVALAEQLRQRQRLLREGTADLLPPALAWSALPAPPLTEQNVPGISSLRHHAQP